MLELAPAAYYGSQLEAGIRMESKDGKARHHDRGWDIGVSVFKLCLLPLPDHIPKCTGLWIRFLMSISCYLNYANPWDQDPSPYFNKEKMRG